MVQLFCLSAHRTLLSTPSLPSSLSPSFALTRDSLSVTRPKPPVSSCRASYHAASVAATVSASKDLYLAAAVAAHKHSWSPLFSTTTPAPPSVCFPDTLASKIHPYYFDCFRLGAHAASPPGAPKHSGTCASSFPYLFSASPPSRQPLSCSLPWQPPSSIIHGIELRRHACHCLQSRLLQDCFCGCTSEHSRHYPGWLDLGTFQLVSVGFRDPGTPCRRCILQQASLGRSVDETRCPRDQPKSAPASRIRRLFLGDSLLMMLSCLS